MCVAKLALPAAPTFLISWNRKGFITTIIVILISYVFKHYSVWTVWTLVIYWNLEQVLIKVKQQNGDNNWVPILVLELDRNTTAGFIQNVKQLCIERVVCRGIMVLGNHCSRCLFTG